MKSIKEINEIDWKLILSSRDTVEYISKLDLIDFSLICKFVRNKLLPHIFESIVLRSFSEGLRDLPFHKANTECKTEALTRYNKRLKKIIPYTRSLVYEHEYNEILLFYIPQVFNKLNRLQLFDCSFTLGTFNKLMNDLNHLENLFVEFCLFLVFDTSDTPIILQLPSSLITFKISYGELMRSIHEPAFSLGDYLIRGNGSNITDLKFKVEIESLPNLKVLMVEHGDQDFMETQNSLISASNQLIRLSTRFSLINELLSTNLQSLKSLTLTINSKFPQRLLDYTFPTLENLKELRIMGGFNLTNYDELIIPSIKKLLNIGKNVEKLTFPYTEIDSLSIEEIMTIFLNLTELSLVKVANVKTLKGAKFNNSIKTLNLIDFDPKLFDLNNIRDSPELKVINIAYEDEDLNYLHINENILTKNNKGWRVVQFYPSSIKCYKC